MTLIHNFTELNKNNADIAGGKGASLGEMMQVGIPVPPGFVVLVGAFERFLEESDIDTKINTILHTLNHEEASEKIRNLILSKDIPTDIQHDILKHFKELNCTYVAVRSSATAEDGADHAWAGQLDSYLNTTEENVLEKVKLCWASLFTPRAIFYRFEKGLDKMKIGVAVVIQKMVDSEMSGIAFSVHPVTEDRNQLIIEAGFGLGEAIVSGQITPDSYVVEKSPRKIIDTQVSLQSKGLYKKENGGNEWKELGKKGELQVLTEAQILELSELIIKIENHYGFPCDIEWAYEAGVFYIVQSRPITTLSTAICVESGDMYKQIFSSDGYAVMNTFYLYQAGYIGKGGVLTCTSNNVMSLYVKEKDLPKYGKAGIEIFESTEKTKILIEKISDQIHEREAIDKEIATANLSQYSNTQITELYKKSEEGFISFLSVYGLLENHYTSVAEEKIQQYIDVEKFENIGVFDVIYSDAVSIPDPSIKTLAENIKKLATFKLEASDRVFGVKNILLREIRERLGFSATDNIRLFSDKEIYEYFLSENPLEEMRNVQSKREKYFCIITDANGEFQIKDGEEAKVFIEELEKNTSTYNSKIEEGAIAGQSASRGIYKGRCVVLPILKDPESVAFKEALHRFNRGDVLVVAATVPQLMPIIEKAGAIVTDEGGVTCHAAIVARELKKPCIIGTKIATSVLKDGDMVEVDADRGIVRVL